MGAMQTQVDVIANNLANVNTTGFKQDRANFSDLLYQEVRRAGLRQPEGNTVPLGLSIGSGVRLNSIDKEFRQGGLHQTGNDLDLAIQGEGFFQLRLQSGQVAYSRDGAFFRDADGNITTNAGNLLEPAVQIPVDVVRIQVTQDGRILGFNAADPQPIMEEQLELARFVNPKGLRAVGDNLYLPTEASGDVETGNPGTAQFGTIVGGFLEQSNVEIVKEMVDLISAQRAYEINANAIKSADEMLRLANNLRA